MLGEHIKLHENDKFKHKQCVICEESFETVHDRNMHIRTHVSHSALCDSFHHSINLYLTRSRTKSQYCNASTVDVSLVGYLI